VKTPGLEAEVEFGELWVRLAGVLVKCYLFAFRMSYSGKAVHLVSATCGQEALLPGVECADGRVVDGADVGERESPAGWSGWRGFRERGVVGGGRGAG
jgi:hypothetical protein